jgi:hypothetical protein
MTLNESHLRFGHGADPIAGTCTKYLIGKGVFLPPKVPLTIGVAIALTDAEQQSAGSLSFSVTGILTHVHKITHQEVEQPVKGALDCGRWKQDRKWHTVFTPLFHASPEIRDSKKEKGQKAT